MLARKYKIAEILILITTIIVPITYAELYPYPGEGTRAIGWAFIFGSYNVPENRFVIYDPTYLLSFGYMVYIVTVAAWLIISLFLVRIIRSLPEKEESRLSNTWLYVLIAFASQMILPGLLLQSVPATHYGFVFPLPVQSVMTIVVLIMRGIPSMSQAITVTTFLTPFAVEAFRTPIFDSGLIWYFPFWKFYYGNGEGGNFAFLRTFGLGGFFPLYLEVLITTILIATGIILAEVLRRAKNNPEWYAIGWVSVLIALVIQIVTPLIAILLSLDGFYLSMYSPLISIPIPSTLAIVGLMIIRRKRSL
jgi:hypothetical protein